MVTKQDLRKEITVLERKVENFEIGINEYIEKNDNALNTLINTNLKLKSNQKIEVETLVEMINAFNTHIKILNLEKKILKIKLGV
jgi:hypothetical protein